MEPGPPTVWTRLLPLPLAGEGRLSFREVSEEDLRRPRRRRVGHVMDPQASINAVHGKPRRWAAANGDSAYQYFLDSEMPSDMTLSEFFSAGGIQLDRDPAEPGEAFVAETLKDLGQRAVAVQIGDYTAALVWADPEVSNTRLHHLYWSDGKVNYGLYADVSAEQMVNLGREFVCR